MKKNKVYKYFVSFYYSNYGNISFYNIELNLNKKIENIDEIFLIEEYLQKRMKLEESAIIPTILNYILMTKGDGWHIDVDLLNNQQILK